MSEWEEFSAYRKMIRDAKAEAWDECGRDLHGDSYPDSEMYLRNPYREETE